MMPPRRFRLTWLLLPPLLLLSACTSAPVTEQAGGDDGSAPVAEQAGGDDGSAPVTEQAGGDDGSAPVAEQAGGDDGSGGGLDVLPVRAGPPEETTGGVPHIQINAVRDLDLTNELSRRAYSIPTLENRASVVTLPGAQSLWLTDAVDITRPDVVVGGREFGHIHADSSMHLWLPTDRALEVALNGWGELHPWVGRDNFWDGVVMVWAPETPEDVAVSVRLIVDAYNFVTDGELSAADFE